MKKSTRGHPASGKRISLNPIPFEEAVTDLLQVKPPSKGKGESEERPEKPKAKKADKKK